MAGGLGRPGHGAAGAEVIVLPFPPSVNRMWRTFRGRMLLSADGRQYRANAVAAVLQSREAYGAAPVVVSITAWLPDNRRRDADNLLKAPLDALVHAGALADDAQIIELRVRKAGVDRARPRLEVTIELEAA
jgi:crossover junction endodeoxyribonuclease RusA